MVIKGNTRIPCGIGAVLYMDCSGGHMNLLMVYNCMELYTHTQISTSNTGEIQILAVDCFNVSILVMIM